MGKRLARRAESQDLIHEVHDLWFAIFAWILRREYENKISETEAQTPDP